MVYWFCSSDKLYQFLAEYSELLFLKFCLTSRILLLGNAFILQQYIEDSSACALKSLVMNFVALFGVYLQRMC